MASGLSGIEKVSVHGGHSGQFCHHASDSLEDVIRAYIEAGFSWVGITEHMAPMSDATRYPDESEGDLGADFLLDRFRTYFNQCRSLQQKYSNKLEVFTAFETETYEGSTEFVNQLVGELKPDYLVGSVHHVEGHCIDYDEGHFQKALATAGSMEALYQAYFDAQYGMLMDLEPSVVGHFDLIRKFDVNYLQTLGKPGVWERVERNLDFISENNLILDLNLRGFDKAVEQYPSMPVLEAALELDIAVVPGDDSHGVKSVGRNFDKGIEILQELGASTDWPKPALINYT
jgi:histidinol-phosphatase (PHP family)